MSAVFSTISGFFIPAVIIIILSYGLCKKTPLYDVFIDGAKDGLKTAVEITPFILAVFVGIAALTSSGAMSLLQRLFAPLFGIIRIPEELISLILLRSVSGSGSLAVAQNIMQAYGTDNLIGRSASVMVGSCETIFYVLALYFGVTSVKNMRYAFHVGIIGYIVSILASVYICMII
jgi:spore maturation protein B